MRKGIVYISRDLLLRGLKIPDHWHVECIHMNEGSTYAIAIISGNEFPEVPVGESPKECRIRITTHEDTYEVLEVRG